MTQSPSLLRFPCVTCGADPGSPCVTRAGVEAADPHAARYRLDASTPRRSNPPHQSEQAHLGVAERAPDSAVRRDDWRRSIEQAALEADEAQDRLVRAVEEARAAGQSWSAIAEVFGTTRQATWQRFARPRSRR